MNGDVEQQAIAFARDYGTLFHGSVTGDQAAKIATAVSQRYRPGVTFFTNGRITAFETQKQAADLIESEIRTVMDSGLGLDMRLGEVHAEAYTESSATCRLTWTYHPSTEGRFASLEPWSFTNIYGYRAAIGDAPAGWEFVLRDQESTAMQKATGSGFEK